MSTKKILVNGPMQPGDLVTQRVKEVGPSTDNGWFDGDLVSVTREVETVVTREVETVALPNPAAVKAGDTVTTYAELAALPEGSAVVDRMVREAQHG